MKKVAALLAVVFSMGVFSVGMVGADELPPEVPGDGCFRTCGGEIPFPFSTGNQHVELAAGEKYILMGSVVFQGIQAFFEVDLEKHPWLASAKRKNYPYYPLLGESKYWRTYEGLTIQLAAEAVGSIEMVPGLNDLQSLINLKSLSDPAVSFKKKCDLD